MLAGLLVQAQRLRRVAEQVPAVEVESMSRGMGSRAHAIMVTLGGIVKMSLAAVVGLIALVPLQKLEGLSAVPLSQAVLTVLLVLLWFYAIGWIASRVYEEGINSVQRGKKLERQTHPVTDLRRPVLYLRSFDADAKGAEIIWGEPTYTPGVGFSGPYVWSFKTEEEQLASVLEEIGPLVAIGKPGEELPELGATRQYVGHGESWQSMATTLMSAAQLAVVRIGVTQGLSWELREALERVEPQRLLLLVPGRDDYEEFRRGTESWFKKALPEYPSGGYGWKLNTGEVHGVIRFRPDWTPEFLRFKATSSRTPLARALKIALMPVFDELGLPYRPLPLSYGAKVIIVFIIALVALAAGPNGCAVLIVAAIALMVRQAIVRLRRHHARKPSQTASP